MSRVLCVSVAAIVVAAPLLMFAGDNPRKVRAVRITTPPVIDGYLNEEVWKLAEPAADFIQRDPHEGQPASERSEIRVLYDDEAVYFGCMFYDSEPGKIVARLTRRDNEIESDEASIRIDSYHDHQTGYEFTFNAAGVKIDVLQYDDANQQDDSWDPVWYLSTRIMNDGWSAEIKIPFRILHYRASASDTAEQIWGINFLRYISRKQEDERWAFSPKSESGFISRFGHLVGLKNLPDPRPLEAFPFVVGSGNYNAPTTYFDRRQRFLGNGGVDIRYGVAQNFSLDATVNPDFGQVEADPAVLNLSTFETFYPEKRPFFIEGTQILHFTTFGGEFGPGMFYSRRIGRALSEDEISLPAPNAKLLDIPQRTAILGAAKLTGKTNGGLSIGVLQAVTQEESALIDTSGVQFKQLLEPLAHYNVIRVKQDVLDGSNVGAIVTSVEKQTRYPAFTNGFDWTLKVDSSRYLFNGFLAASHTTDIDTNRVAGSAGKLNFSKVGGVHWLWSVNGDWTSRRYNIDDVGFFFSPDDIGTVGELDYKEDRPGDILRNYKIGLGVHHRWNFDGANLFRGTSVSGSFLFANYWSLQVNAGADFGLYDHRETRGNGLYRKPKNYTGRIELTTDPRDNVIIDLSQNIGNDFTRGLVSTQLAVQIRPVTWVDFSVQSSYWTVRHVEAWVDNVTAGTATASIFGDRSTDQFDLTLRSNITFTPELTLQFYGQLFNAKGHYENFRQLVGTSDFIPNNYTKDPDFNRHALHSNVVLRWEYMPGSILFFVWSHARSGTGADYFTSFTNDFGESFQAPPSNVLLLKMSYRLSL